MAFAALHSGETVERIGKTAWNAVRVFAVETVGVRAFENTIWNTRHPKFAGLGAPRCRRIFTEENWLPATSRVRAFYKTLRDPGRAKLFIDIGSQQEKKTHDVTGKLIDGQVKGQKSAFNFKQITEGSNIVPVARTLIKLSTAFERNAFSAGNIARIMTLIGTVNRDRLVNFGGFKKGTLLLLGAPSTHVWDEDDLWYADFIFQFSGKTPWNDLVKTQEHVRLPRLTPALTTDTTGNLTLDIKTPLRSVMMSTPGKLVVLGDPANGTFTISPTDEEDVKLYEEKSFATLDAMIQW